MLWGGGGVGRGVWGDCRLDAVEVAEGEEVDSHALVLLADGGPLLVTTGAGWGRGWDGGEGRGGLAPLLLLNGGGPPPRVAGVGWGRGWGEVGVGVAPLSAKDAASACCISC